MTEVRILSGEDIEGLASPEEYVDPVRDAYRERGQGAPANPPEILFRRNRSGMLTSYGAILPGAGVMGGYMYGSVFEEGDSWFVIPLFDADTGELLALIDGASMNPFKTGAAGAVGVDALAREDAKHVGLFGSGPQARGQIKATASVRDLETVSVYSPTRPHRERFAVVLDDYLEADVMAVNTSKQAVANADVVITATNSPEPVFDGSLLQEGAHVTAMGQYLPDTREIDATTVSRGIYVPDLRERATSLAGAYVQALEEGVIDDGHLHAELGEIVAGKAPGRTTADDVTIFDCGGTALETVAGANLLYQKAVADGRGTLVSFSPASEALTGR
ncbi:ornithine cyclodeaminase family protein [Haloarculaceae archaeon H-GB2-1]|nr:ornithine cyclodeaminase family protein [Haloarculaceae archaeon H-GB1-1]MEA5409657.1 ornithine cyclodeaminase family protein [Haloarculaceae archaeon H-GB2-1]